MVSPAEPSLLRKLCPESPSLTISDSPRLEPAFPQLKIPGKSVLSIMGARRPEPAIPSGSFSSPTGSPSASKPNRSRKTSTDKSPKPLGRLYGIRVARLFPEGKFQNHILCEILKKANELLQKTGPAFSCFSQVLVNHAGGLKGFPRSPTVIYL